MAYANYSMMETEAQNSVNTFILYFLLPKVNICHRLLYRPTLILEKHKQDNYCKNMNFINYARYVDYVGDAKHIFVK